MAATLADYYRTLMAASEEVVDQSLGNPELLGRAHQHIEDLNTWVGQLQPRPEAQVLSHVANELQFSLFSVVAGHYRQAFGSLRLSLELSLSVIHFSANRIDLIEWLNGGRDVNWNSVVDLDNGVLGHRFVRAFCPELVDNVIKFNEVARKAYRALSEYVHGNAKTWKLTPSNLRYDETLLQEWSVNFNLTAKVIMFALTVRFLGELTVSQIEEIEAPLLDLLGPLESVRAALIRQRKGADV